MANSVAPRLGLPWLQIHVCSGALRAECVLECSGRRKPPKSIRYTSRSEASSDSCALATHDIGGGHNPKLGFSPASIR